MDRIAKSMMIKGFISLVMLGTMVYTTGSIVWGTIGLAIAWALTLVGYDVRSCASILKAMARTSGDKSIRRADPAIELRPRLAIGALRKLTWLTLPLGFVTMLISLHANIPRYFIEHYLGERELGIFAAMAYLMVAGNTVVNALGQSASPRLAKYYAVGNSTAFRTLLLKLVGIGVLLGTVGVLIALLAGREILILVYRPEYANQASVLIWIMVATGISYVGSFIGYGVSATRVFSRFTIPYLVVTIVAFGFSALFIPAFGLIGAAWALCVASLASFVAITVVLKTVRI
jgi:O-antigen/teichoic acid export membrane protein